MNSKSLTSKQKQTIKRKDKFIDKGLSFLNKTILIVDDEYNFRLLFRELIEHISPNLEILDVKDGTEAIELIRNRNGKINLISTDINHLGIYGLELAKSVKKNYPHIKVLVCSAYRSALNSGDWANYIDHFLDKPFEVEEYMRIVKKLLDI